MRVGALEEKIEHVVLLLITVVLNLYILILFITSVIGVSKNCDFYIEGSFIILCTSYNKVLRENYVGTNE